MHIAFVSFEYPPDTADGGIATYVQQAVRMLLSRGHTLEVFAASRTRTLTENASNLHVYRIKVADRQEFVASIAPIFAKCHTNTPFDVLEAPDFNADARHIVTLTPDIPLVVRLHTPRYLANALNTWSAVTAESESLTESQRQIESSPPYTPQPLPDYDYLHDPEYLQILQADGIAAPSHAIRNIVCRDWNLNPGLVEVIPNVYQPAPALLELPVATATGDVTFIGRLEQRKGVLTLAQAIPMILKRRSHTRFRFVGRPIASPDPSLNMREYLQHLLAPYTAAITFTGLVPLEGIPQALRDAQVCVFPSRWENFPCVCLEAMAAGRGIVGSMEGGMAEMLQDRAGVLVAPDNPAQLADAIVMLLDNPAMQREMGQQARSRVQALYGIDRIAPLQEASYRRAIAHRQQTGPRHST